ncbi:50S ribosomal protein L18 [Marivirga arenosa]|uniref:Large ribosomal subunit protein uL18 n=1 Tax=Marivirga arenosa TaxID=3059076 RepID=A0AA49GF67_9BACT|nr:MULTISPECIES: 50S ribosomal protein L18 [unclassified Marivirga]WKK81949.1 50S ribosomal protein L18 [Marivirga sp. BKB1-2]WKK87346.2 50S ribosomal protein L18 [Marivirga sp. ABR2-2]
MAISKQNRRARIKKGIRRKISGTAETPRLSVFKSNRAIYAQVIDDLKGHTLAAANSLELGAKSNADIDTSAKVGEAIAKRAKEAGIETIVFDRGGYRFHGRVKALADGARKGGLKF